MIMNTPQIQDFAGKRIHMIGIGGSSMSGLAQMLQHLGYQVTGSDQNDGYLMNDVRQAGAKVTIGHRAENVHGADLVVYTAAIPLTNPERAEAERLHIPSMERAELLGQLMRHYARAIGICGAHGKTTTTSMLSEILVECGLDPSVHIGGKLDAEAVVKRDLAVVNGVILREGLVPFLREGQGAVHDCIPPVLVRYAMAAPMARAASSAGWPAMAPGSVTPPANTVPARRHFS